MQLKIKGELIVFNELIEAVRKRLEVETVEGNATAELTDDDNHGNSLYFEFVEPSGIKRGVRVEFLYWYKNDFAFRLRYRSGSAYLEDTCIFPMTQVERGVNAVASLLKQRLLARDVQPFQDYFEKEKQ